MAFKKVQDLSTTETVSFANPGQTFEGYYLGSRSVKTDFEKPSYLHVFQTASGGNTGVWGAAKLDGFMASVRPGTLTHITYNGKTKIGGGKTIKEFAVLQDTENTIEVGAIAGAATLEAAAAPNEAAAETAAASTEMNEEAVNAVTNLLSGNK